MKLTIIETGRPPEPLRDRFPDYPDMFAALIGPHVADLQVETVALLDGDVLPDPETLEATLITGSAFGVYEDVAWMGSLMDFIRWTAAKQVPQIGICFGHQAIGQALGGQVIKSPKGWGLGRHTYDVVQTPSWMGDTPPESISLAVSHQDQVVVPPPGATILVTSDFCPNAALAYAQGPAISFQGHPEFENAFAAALYDHRRRRPLTDDEVARATASLESPDDNMRLGAWLGAFLTQSIDT